MTEPTATFTTEGHMPVLIEDWLPIRELGIESVRERQAASALPPLSFLHIWWARAPLAAAHGVTLTSLLPVWSDNLLDNVDGLRDALKRVRANRPDLQTRAEAMTDADWYRQWVLWACGIWGDAIAAEERIRVANIRGERLGAKAYGWKQAYRNAIPADDIAALHSLLRYRWGRLPRVLDPTAGGGSIPFTSSRYGLPTWANDLNAVAVGVLDATVRAPAHFGASLIPDLEKWGSVLIERCRKRLEELFPVDAEATHNTFLFANTVACPRTGGPVPLAPNWWLDKSGEGLFARPIPKYKDGTPSHIEFAFEHVGDNNFDPDKGTVGQGQGLSPWDGLVIDGDYIKSEATAGRMWATMYAIACKRPKKKGRGSDRYFRSPTADDLNALDLSSARLAALESEWADADVIPYEDFPAPIPKHDIRPYGFCRWRDFFTDRQLLVHGTFVEEWRKISNDVIADLGRDRGAEVMTLLGMMQNKAVNWNSRSSSWNVNHQAARSTFDRHDFSFKWTFCEFEGARELFPWCLSQLLDAYSGVSALMTPDVPDTLLEGGGNPGTSPGRVTLSSGSASNLATLDDASIELVNIDPPYYDNVMYAELADYFYVWEKRTLGLLHPERFIDELTNKDDEAVANVARFLDAGRRKKELATFDYQQKMQSIFAECSRALVDDGVMVVWFTHKRAEAWDTLATAMMEAGFTIEASWPVATQPENALNHAKKNSAKSTIMLICRKRLNLDENETFFEDIEAEVRQAARTAVAKFEQEVGIGGVDLQLATYGPTLSVISRNWPVLSSEPDETGRSRRLRPEEALDVARQEVARLRMHRLVGKDATFDPATDFWLMCWETFQAREFPYDEARKLALGVGYDVDAAMSSGLLKKKAGNVELVSPATRGRSLRRTVDDAGRFDRLVDAVHFMLVTYRDDKLAAARTWLSDSGYGDEQRFIDAVQASVNAVPRVRNKKGLTLDEAVLLEDGVVGLFGDEVSLPVEAEEQFEAEQMTLGG